MQIFCYKTKILKTVSLSASMQSSLWLCNKLCKLRPNSQFTGLSGGFCLASEFSALGLAQWYVRDKETEMGLSCLPAHWLLDRIQFALRPRGVFPHCQHWSLLVLAQGPHLPDAGSIPGNDPCQTSGISDSFQRTRVIRQRQPIV